MIPVILLATVAALFFLVRHWRTKTQEELKHLRGELRRFQNSRRQLELAVEHHSADDPEPYGSRAERLLVQLQEIGEQTEALEHRHVALREEMKRLQTNRWQETFGAPYFWFRLRLDVTALSADLEQARQALAAADESGQALKRLGWEVAQQARQVQTTQDEANRQLEALLQRNVSGQAVDAAVRQEAQSRLALREVPEYFFTGDETSVLQQASKESIAHTYSILAAHQPVLEKLVGQSRTWQKQVGAAVEVVGRLRNLLAEIEQSLDGAPQGLNLEPLEERFNGLQQISDTLHATLSRLEAESISSLLEETGRVYGAAQELQGEIQRARQDWMALMELLPELGDGLRDLSAQFAELGSASLHPVTWDQSRVRLTTLSRQASGIGPKTKPRTPEQVNRDTETATRLNEQRKELAKHFQEIAAKHDELQSLLAGPELGQGLDWTQLALKRLNTAAQYSPENWPRADGIAELPDELEALADDLRGLNEIKGEALPEGEVAGRADEARQLAAAVRTLRERFERAQQRLDEIQQTERQTLEQFEKARNAFNQIAFVVRSNAFLQEIASADISKLQKDFQAMTEELEDHARSTIDRKSKLVAALAGRVETAANGWLDALTKDLTGALESLSGFLANLNAVAPLEEQAVSEAKRLVSTGPSFTPSSPGGRSTLSLEAILPEVKRRSDYWQECAAALGALEDLESNVYESYQSAREFRDYTRQVFADLNTWMRGQRGWPPTTIHMDGERQELERLEKQWEVIKNTPTKAISVVGQLGTLTAKYQALAEKVRQAAERADQDQAQFQALEAEFVDLTEQWQEQMRAHRDNPIASQEIRALVGELEGGLEEIKNQYRQGKKNYDQTFQALKLLHRKARMSQVPFDENHVMDVHGRMIAYR